MRSRYFPEDVAELEHRGRPHHVSQLIFEPHSICASTSAEFIAAAGRAYFARKASA